MSRKVVSFLLAIFTACVASAPAQAIPMMPSIYDRVDIVAQSADLLNGLNAGSSKLFRDGIRPNDTTNQYHCGENLLLMVRGSGESPQGKSAVPAGQLTYQQWGQDLFANDYYFDKTGGGRLGVGVINHVPKGSFRAAALVYPADPIRVWRGLDSVKFFQASANVGADQLSRALAHIYDNCPDNNEPRLSVVGYSQGSDVINIVLTRAQHDPALKRNVEKVVRFGNLADPSRRISGVENDKAGAQMQATSAVGGISRFVTEGINKDLVHPELDEYRDSHPGQITSWCVAGDYVCDTRASEPREGIWIHGDYHDTIARCNGTYTYYLDCFYSDMMAGMGIQRAPVPVSRFTIAPGWFHFSISRGLRNEQVAQTVRLQVIAPNGQVLREGFGDIRPGASGSGLALLLPWIPQQGSQLVVGIGDTNAGDDYTRPYREIQRFAVDSQLVNLYANPELFLSGADETRLGPPLVSEVQRWDVPFDERIGLIRQLMGPTAANIFRLLLQVNLRYRLDPEHTMTLQQLEAQGKLDAGVLNKAVPLFGSAAEGTGAFAGATLAGENLASLLNVLLGSF